MEHLLPYANEVWGKVMFLQVSVILSTGGSASVHAGRPPCQGDPPAKERPWEGDQILGLAPKGEIEGGQIQAHTQGEIQGDQIQTHTQGGNSGGSGPGQHPTGKFRGIRTYPLPDDYCCGRYASYWNAFLSCIIFLQGLASLRVFSSRHLLNRTF